MYWGAEIFVSELIMETATGGEWPVLMSHSQAALGSAALRLGTVATRYQPAGVHEHLSSHIT